MTTFNEAKEAFLADGWTLRHTSMRDGKVSSLYFEKSKTGALTADPRKMIQVRISDHFLGTTVYGEVQGAHLDFDFNLGDTIADDVPAKMLIEATKDDDIYEILNRGYSPSDLEWEDELAEIKASYGQ